MHRIGTSEVLKIYAGTSAASVASHIAKAKANTHKLPDLVKGMTDSQVARYDWDKLVFGFSNGEILDLAVSDIHPSKQDMLNVQGQSMRKYFGNAPLESLPPITVKLHFAEFYLDDGHHRYGYALELGSPIIKAEIEIHDNPLKHLDLTMDDILQMRDKTP